MPRAPSEASAGTLQGSLWRSDSNLLPISCPSCLVCGTSSGTCSWTHPPWSLAWRRNPAPRERRPVSSARERGGAFAVSSSGCAGRPSTSIAALLGPGRPGGCSLPYRWVVLPPSLPLLGDPSLGDAHAFAVDPVATTHLDGAHTRSHNLSVKNANKLPKMMTHD